MPRNGSPFKSTSTITCCHHCVPPKRHTACWGHCPEYLEERAKLDAENEERRKKEAIEYGLNAQTRASVKRAQKGGK